MRDDSKMRLGLGDEDNINDSVPAGTIQKCYRECSSLIFILDDLNSEFVHLTYEDYKKMPAKLLAVFKLYRHLLIMNRNSRSNRDNK